MINKDAIQEHSNIMRIRWIPWVGASVLGLLFTGCTSSLKTEGSRLSGSAPDIAIRAEDPLLTGCRDALLAHAAYLETLLPKMAVSADQVAKRLMEGGSLYVAGERSFISEASGRAGGMMMLSVLQKNSVIKAGDVLFLNASTPEDDLAKAICERAKEGGAYIVLFAPASPDWAGLCDMNVDGAVAEGKGMDAAASPALLNIIGLWTYTGEVVAACTRRGKTPVLFQSGGVPGGQERNAKYRTQGNTEDRRFHRDIAVAPQPKGYIGGLYLAALERQLGSMRGATLAQINVAAEMLASSVRAGGTVHLNAISHFAMYEINGVVPWAIQPKNVTVTTLADTVKPNDVYLEVGYFEPNASLLEAVRVAGGKSIQFLCHKPIISREGAQPDLILDMQWSYGDGEVLLPAYDVPILPTSGVMQMAFFYTSITRAQALLAGSDPTGKQYPGIQ